MTELQFYMFLCAGIVVCVGLLIPWAVLEYLRHKSFKEYIAYIEKMGEAYRDR